MGMPWNGQKWMSYSTKNWQDTLIISHENILPNRTGNSLQRLMRLTLLIVVLHILQRSKRRFDGEIEALVPGIGERLAHGRAEDVGFSVLLLSECSYSWRWCVHVGISTLTAVLARTLYCSKTRLRSSSLGILKRVIRSIGAILAIYIYIMIGVQWMNIRMIYRGC